MKKLIFLSVFTACSAGLFASPLVYDFRASIKHTYLKEKMLKVGQFNCDTYVKYTKSSLIKGYLILDQDGVTSRSLNPASTAQCQDFGRHRGFLVVMNKSAEKAVQAPKCLPVILDAKYYNSTLKESNTFPAQGNLFVGGDLVTNQMGAATYADYYGQSASLFGKFNEPTLEDKTFHDCWFSASGCGKVSSPPEAVSSLWTFDGPMLVSLSGNLTAGVFICKENGADLGDEVSAKLYLEASCFPSEPKNPWRNGAVELATTDVGYGSWSIKLNQTFFKPQNIYEQLPANLIKEEDNQLLRSILAAGYKLNRNQQLKLTPEFCSYYGLTTATTQQ